MKRIRTYRAFTLVELLVVIGIIALLISVLLPALNKARQQANSLACKADLRQIGQLLNEYAAEHKGYLPYGLGQIKGGQADYIDGPWDTPQWYWSDTLQLLLTPNVTQANGGSSAVGGDQSGWYTWAGPAGYYQNQAYQLSNIFHDNDTPDGSSDQRRCDYTANARAMPDVNLQDFLFTESGASATISTPCYMPIRQLASFKASATSALVWCSGVQMVGSTIVGADTVSTQLDNSELSYGDGFAEPSADPSYEKDMGNPISLGQTYGAAASGSPGSCTLPVLRAENTDANGPYGDAAAEMRFRHMNNTQANILFIDGHVESRSLGDVYARDVCVTPVYQYARQPGT